MLSTVEFGFKTEANTRLLSSFSFRNTLVAWRDSSVGE